MNQQPKQYKIKINTVKNNTMQLRKAIKKQVKMRLGLSGASGFGKTYSALLLAYGLTNDWNKIAVIDTENSSSELYADLGDYNVLPLSAPYSPERYIEAIKACENGGMEVIIIDSISHEWEGKGGCLEIQEKLGGKYQDWAKVTPRHQAFLESILTSNCHIITTVRRKQDYNMVSEGNKTKVVKVGTKEVTRDGFEYELTVSLEIVNDQHLVRASKDRTGLFMDKPEFVVTPETGKLILDWCNSGESVFITQAQKDEINSLLSHGLINDSEREKTRSVLDKMDFERANKAIANLKKTIDDRENAIAHQLAEEQAA